MNCKTCGIELSQLNTYMQNGKLRHWCKKCWQNYNKAGRERYAAKNPDKLEAWSLRRVHRYHFGGNREAVLERDGHQCVNCGMTQEQHMSKWNRSLTVDHIDGNGLHVAKDQKNNDMDNLQTLCLSCHGTKDINRRWQGVTV